MGEHIPRTDEIRVRVPVPPSETMKISKEGTVATDWWFCPVCRQEVWSLFADAHAGFCGKSELVTTPR